MGIQAQEKVAFVGPSGFGKTTMLNLISGISIPDSGTINIGDEAIHKLSDVEKRNYRIRHIGFVFQDFKLLEYLPVLDNILLPFRINRSLKRGPDVARKAYAFATSLGIGDKLSKYPARLSHGERQRVAIARALINDPKIILADEPTGNLDPDNKLRIKQILFEQASQRQATLITVTHDHELLEGFDRVIDFSDFHPKAVT